MRVSPMCTAASSTVPCSGSAAAVVGTTGSGKADARLAAVQLSVQLSQLSNSIAAPQLSVSMHVDVHMQRLRASLPVHSCCNISVQVHVDVHFACNAVTALHSDMRILLRTSCAAACTCRNHAVGWQLRLSPSSIRRG